MRIRVALIGSGAPGDAFRCNLPHYVMVAVDYGRMLAVVDVRDDDFPDVPALKAALTAAQDAAAVDQAPLGVALAKAWHDHLDARYKERMGEFRPTRK